MSDESFPVRWTGNQAIVVLPEQIDVSNAGQIRELLLAIINRGAGALVADMSATVSCDHAASDALLRAFQRAVASGTELRLVAASTVIRRVLSLTGIDRLVPIYPSLEAGLAAHVPSLAAPRPGDGEGWRAGAGVPHVPDGDVHRLPGAGTDGGMTDIGVETALLDHDGVIVSVNQAWLVFAEANGGDPARTGPGMSYLEACAAAGDDPAARQVTAAIRAALAGDLPGPLVIEVPCHSPDTERWYEMLISSRPGRDGQHPGAAVTLSLARSRLRSQPLDPEAGLRPVPELRRAGLSGQAQRVAQSDARDRDAWSPDQSPAMATPGTVMAMIDAISDGIALTDSDSTLKLTNRRLDEMFGYQHAELRGQPVGRLIPAHLQDAHHRRRASYAGAPAARPVGAGARLVGLRKDGSTFPAETSLSPFQAATGWFTLAVVRDVTVARRLEERADLTAAEARQAALDLPDDIAGNLFHVGLILQNAADLAGAAASQHIAEALDRLDEAIGKIRDVAFASDTSNPPPEPSAWTNSTGSEEPE